MSLTVDRTCTETRPGSDGRVERGESRPLRTFGSLDAYVLLGDPGAGKTTEFKRETRVLGEAAEYVSARNFIRLDLESHPEWRDKTLFIDGLDEMRAGVADSRVPLDEIRNRLERLGRPRFRISCREADWLGNNDRRSLEAVSPDGSIPVLQLDPLSPEAATELLRSPSLGAAADGFLEEARTRGIGGLLGNPLTLGLLVDAFRHGGGWPASRLETFETACRQMVTEQNEDHQVGTVPQPAETVLEAAGYLSALLLLSGRGGYSLTPDAEGPALVSLDAVVGGPGCHSRTGLKNALATRLFVPVGDRAFGPVHRLVAEFLAGRYLADLIRRGLPARRVVGLMVGGSDGRVVTVLRGLSAWLAAHPGEARRQLIDADPVGVGIYGDISGFATGDRKRLLRSIAAFAREGPLSGHQWRDGRANEAWYDSGWAFRSLASGDMVPVIDELLSAAVARPKDDRLIDFVLDLLSEADREEVESLATLTSAVRAILLEVATRHGARQRALDAYVRLAPVGSDKTQTLTGLLKAVREGGLPDPDNELVGTLLDRLYPDLVTPSQVWHYVVPRNRSEVIGRYWRFWEFTLEERSSDEHVAELLDAFHRHAAHLNAEREESPFGELPLRLLVRGLEALDEQFELTRLYDWLSAVGRSREVHPDEEHKRRVRAWLEARPEIQKSVYLEWLRRRRRDDLLGDWRCYALHGSVLPPDFGAWCLDQAIAISETDPPLAQELLSEAHRSLGDPARSEGLTLDVLVERVRGHRSLAETVDRLTQQRSSERSVAHDRHLKELDALREQARADQRRRRDEWSDLIRSEEADLWENRFPPQNLNTLAKAYFGLFAGADREATARARIAEFIGGDSNLVDAVLAGLRGAVTRGDVPAAERTISLHLESKHSWLAYPVLAGAHLLDAEDPARLDALDEIQKRNILALHYCVPLGLVSARWHDRWFQKDPGLVLDVLFQAAVGALRAGDELPPGANELAIATGHEDLVQEVRLRLLRAYPTRGPQGQLQLLDRLLRDAFKFPDKSALRALVETKLSFTSMTVAQRVRWMAADALLSPTSGFPVLMDWVRESERRVRYLAEFFRNISDRRGLGGSILDTVADVAALKCTIETLGGSYRPFTMSGEVTIEMEMSGRIEKLITQLGSLPGDEARQALGDLIDDPQLAAWKDRLVWSVERQRVVHRDASYQHPTIDAVRSTLSNLAPANVADLAALLVGRLGDIAQDARGGDSNLWRQFWNEDRYGAPIHPKPENSCRDALLASLRGLLPPEVDLAPERSYASAKRADIGAVCGAFNVPIEIKPNSAVDLWSALRRQLIGRYTTAPATFGYGVFLVLWFGADKTARPRDGSCPTTPAELAERLEKDLSPDEARKISVIVIDVTKP